MRVGLRHGDRKLVATDPAADIGGSHHALQLLRHQLERTVACAVPVAVVDLLQVVDVDHHHGDLAVVPLCKSHLALDCALELAAVGQSGEVVGARLAGELAGTVERDRDLIRDRGHHQQLRGAEDPISPRADRHHAYRTPTDSKLCAQRIPSVVCRHAVHS